MLQAEIHQRLFTVLASKTPAPTDEWFDEMDGRLEEWRTGYWSEPQELLTTSWMELHYNLSRQLLFRPNPGNPSPNQLCLRKAIDASSFLMRRYKAMWRVKAINFVWLAIHHVFVSGVTYLNAVWLAARQGWSITPSFVDVMLDIQACSQALEAMTGEIPDQQH
jgi:hypothetical protein